MPRLPRSAKTTTPSPAKRRPGSNLKARSRLCQPQPCRIQSQPYHSSKHRQYDRSLMNCHTSCNQTDGGGCASGFGVGLVGGIWGEVFSPDGHWRQGWLAGGRRWAAVQSPSCPWVAGALPGVGSGALRSLELVFAPEISVPAGGSGALGLARRPLPAFSLSLRLISGQASPPDYRPRRSANMGSTCALAQCIPEPLSRASTTSLLALSTAPLPMG